MDSTAWERVRTHRGVVSETMGRKLGSHLGQPVGAKTPGTLAVLATSQAGLRVGRVPRRWRTKRRFERWAPEAQAFAFCLTKIAIAEPALRAWLAELASQWNPALGGCIGRNLALTTGCVASRSAQLSP